jgi:hypothetical protein
MDWKELSAKITSLGLPILGMALGGPAGATVGALIASTISKELSSDTPVDASQPALISQAIDKYGPQAVEMLKSELEHDARIKQIALDTEAAYLQDRQDARKRDAQITQQGYHNYRADIMLALVFIALIYITYVINANVALKPEVLAIFNMMIGALLKMIGDAFQFEFGSSRGSKTKDDEKSILMKFMANGK